MLFGRLPSDDAVLVTVNIWIFDCEFDNYVCAHVETPRLFVDLLSMSSRHVAVVRPTSGRDSAAVDGQGDAVDEAGIVAGEEDDGRGEFLGLGHAACWC